MSNHTNASTALSHAFVLVDDQDKALAFYRDALGFAVKDDVTMEDFRWLSVTAPGSPDIEITLQDVATYPGAEGEDRDAMRRLLAKGLMSGLIFVVDDVDAMFERVAATGADVLQEPTDQFYGVRDCAFRDPAGNMVRLNQVLPAS